MAKIVGGVTATTLKADDALDPNSTNPVQNGAVARRVLAVESGAYQLNERMTAIEADIADLKYVEIKISSINNNVGTVEMGSTVNSVTINWALNKAPVSQTVDGNSVDASARSTTLSGLALTSGKTYTVTATDERNATATASTSIVFYNGVYYGVTTDGATVNSAAILALTRKLQGSKGLTFTANAGAGQRIVYALPSRYGTPNFNVGGFDGGFSKTATISFTNASGYTENYDVWVSDNTGLGNTTVKVS